MQQKKIIKVAIYMMNGTGNKIKLYLSTAFYFLNCIEFFKYYTILVL